MNKERKNKFIQIRVSPIEKSYIKRNAKISKMDMSEWILSKILKPNKDKFDYLISQLSKSKNKSFVLADLNEFLSQLSDDDFLNAVDNEPKYNLSTYLYNYVAAMIEYSANKRGVTPPVWLQDIPKLKEPKFGSDLKNLRLYLLLYSPIPFRKRNIFIDSSIGARV